MIFASASEAFSIGALIPFLGALTSPQTLYENERLQPLLSALSINSAQEILAPMTIAFATATVVAASLRLLLLWSTTRLSFIIGADIGIQIYKKTLFQPYQVHVSRNSSEVISGIVTKSHTVIVNTILPALNLISAGVMIISILTVLILVDPIITAFAFCALATIYVGIYIFTKNRIAENSKLISKNTTAVTKSLSEGLGAIRDILLDRSQEIYCEVFRRADSSLRNAQAMNIFIAQSPRFVVEGVAIIVISGLAYKLAGQSAGESAMSIPILGAMALGAQRMLPVVQLAYGAVAQIRSGEASLKDTIELLDQPLPMLVQAKDINDLPFERTIEFHDVTFQYRGARKPVLNKVGLSIRRGERVAIIGATGSGKSTLIDILLGLLEPSIGYVTIDEVIITAENRAAWQARVAHVPQVIFIADGSVAQNIAFGVPPEMIDMARVQAAAVQARISDVIESWPDGYGTRVGERGALLSGGQRQRIGIARAFYKQAEVIVLDEATNALDITTEASVMQAILGLGSEVTVIMVTHRRAALSVCDQIIEVTQNGLHTRKKLRG